MKVGFHSSFIHLPNKEVDPARDLSVVFGLNFVALVFMYFICSCSRCS